MSDYGIMLDIINEADKVIGTEESEEAHKRGLLHRAVHIVVVNSQGKLYVRKRNATLELYPGVWTTSVGEHVESGQQYDDAASRALEEFLGLNTALARLGKTRVHDAIENEMVMVSKTSADTIPYLNPEHSEQGEFLSIEDVAKLSEQGATTPHLAAALTLYLEHIGP